MAISYVGSSIASADSVAIPSHQAGDLILLAPYRHNSATTPTTIAGWSIRFGSGSNSNWLGVAYKIAASSSETSGTWTGATQIAASVYRSTSGKLLSVGSAGTFTGTSTAMTYSTIANMVANAILDSWVVGVCGSRVDGAAETPPTGMTNRQSTVSTGELALHDTNGTATSWTAVTVTTPTATNRIITLEILELDYVIPVASGGLKLPGWNGGFSG